MGKVPSFGTPSRPSPTSKGIKKQPHSHPAEDTAKYRMESQYYHCKNCGFRARKDRNRTCPLCGTEKYWTKV